MQTTCLTLGIFATNTYIVRREGAAACLLIDPADSAQVILRRLEDMGTAPVAVLLTHGHYDHILAVPALQQAYPELPVYCHPEDIAEEDTEADMGMVFPTIRAFSGVRTITDGDMFSAAGLTVKVIHTPGHTKGSVTFDIDGVLFTGDTLFCGSIGRTDFPGGDIYEMRRSLARLAELSVEDAKVYPGHDKSTTLAHERIYNPYMKKIGKY